MFKPDNELTFKQIILEYYKKILDIATNEFTGGYEDFVFAGNATHKKYVTDKRQEFTQAVEMLARATANLFDDEMKGYWNEFKDADTKVYEEYSDKEGFITDDKDNQKWSFLRLQLAKDLFEHLSFFLNRKHFLANRSYIESGGEGFYEDNENEKVD